MNDVAHTDRITARAPAEAFDVADGHAHRGVCAIASGNGMRAVAHLGEKLSNGTHRLDALAQAIGLVEDDPDDVSVGYGGLPNSEGIVELDAAIVDGQTSRTGAVAAMRDVRHAARVALRVLRDCDHNLLVGDGARTFALAQGFAQEDLLAPEARAAFEAWQHAGGRAPEAGAPGALLSDEDRWSHLDGDEPDRGAGIPYSHGTVHASCVDAAGYLAGCTSTSGLSYKLPGRVGDSPIVGAGLYASNIASAGATGRGEACMENASAFDVVRRIEEGQNPTQACLSTLKRMADRTTHPPLLEESGRPAFNVTLYAVRSDGAYGSAAMYSGYSFCVHDGSRPRRLEAPFLYQRDR